MMSRIVVEAESASFEQLLPERQHTEQLSIAETICEAMAHAARELDLRAIAIYTQTGTTPRMLSKYRPCAPIYAFTASEAVCNRMNLFWGVTPLRCPTGLSAERMAEFAEAELSRRKVLARGEIFGLVAGATETTGATNFLRLITPGESGR